MRPSLPGATTPFSGVQASPEGQTSTTPHPINAGILVVEDENEIRTILDLGLRPHGFSVFLAANGQEALELYQRYHESIAVVLLDVQMPGIDGPQTVATLRAITPALRYCFMSGNTGRYTEKDLQQQGAMHVFRKPFQLQEVVQILQHVLQDSSRSLPDLPGAAPVDPPPPCHG